MRSERRSLRWPVQWMGAVVSLSLALTPGASFAAPAGAKQKKAQASAKALRTLLVLPLQVDGIIPRRVKDRYERSALSALESEHFETRFAKECQDLKCALSADPGVKRPVVLRQVLSAKERNYTLSAELIDGPTGRVLATSKESCELCGVGEVSELFVARASVIKDKVESADAFGSTLTVNSVPSGAEIYVDGQMVGNTPASLKLTPGRHKVELRKKGHTSSRKAITTVNGVREILDFELSKILRAPVRDPRLDHRPRAISAAGWGWLAIGVGGAGLAAGTALVVLHKRPFTFRCDPAMKDRDANGNCRYLYDTQDGGIMALSIGGALLATGIGLTVWSHQRAKRRSKRAGIAFEPAADGLRFRF